MPNQSILNTPSPATHKREALRQLSPQAVETDADGRIRVNAAQMQLAQLIHQIDPSVSQQLP